MRGRGGRLTGQEGRVWPTPDDYIVGTTEAFTHGWAAGYADGYRAAEEDAAERRVYAHAAAAGIAAIDTVTARRKADERARQIAADYRAGVTS